MWSQGRSGASGTKLFCIDHPLDPANKYLQHYCSEGPEPLNVYSGTIVLGPDGEAWVELPEYFGAINNDLRYQLTCVGAFAPVFVAQEVMNNWFRIAGGFPGLKVSWEVKGVRVDPYVRTYGAPVEVEKPTASRGRFLHPELYGQPAHMGEHYSPSDETPGSPPAPIALPSPIPKRTTPPPGP